MSELVAVYPESVEYPENSQVKPNQHHRIVSVNKQKRSRVPREVALVDGVPGPLAQSSRGVDASEEVEGLAIEAGLDTSTESPDLVSMPLVLETQLVFGAMSVRGA